MELKIGNRLTRLRKEKGLTQEQLAEKLGVSAPAVSKWETDHSYPDITLLSPLARALDTNLDTLLQFEETLSDKEVIEKINVVVETARQAGYEAGEGMLSGLLYQYPNSAALKFQAAAALDAFLLFFPAEEETTTKRWTALKKDLLEEVRASGLNAYWQRATLNLAGIAVREEKLEYAEQLLKELPEYTADPTITWSLLYRKKNEPEEALKLVQKRLYSLIRQVQTCLTVMLEPEIIPDYAQELKICEVYKSLDQLFGLGGMYDGLFLEIYLRQKRFKEAADCLLRYADALLGTAVLPKHFLFSPGLSFQDKEAQPASLPELRKMLLRGLEDPAYQELFRYPQGKKALEKLKESLAAEKS